MSVEVGDNVMHFGRVESIWLVLGQQLALGHEPQGSLCCTIQGVAYCKPWTAVTSEGHKVGK